MIISIIFQAFIVIMHMPYWIALASVSASRARAGVDSMRYGTQPLVVFGRALPVHSSGSSGRPASANTFMQTAAGDLTGSLTGSPLPVCNLFELRR